MITCRRCSSVLPEYARFCGYCGCMVKEQEHVLTALLESNRTALLDRPSTAQNDGQTMWEPISDAELAAIVASEESYLNKPVPPPELSLPLLLSEEEWPTEALASGDFPVVSGPLKSGPLPAAHDQVLFALRPASSATEEARDEAAVALAQREFQPQVEQYAALPTQQIAHIVRASPMRTLARVLQQVRDQYAYKPAQIVTAVSAAVVVAAVVASLVIVLQSRIPNSAATLPSLFISGNPIPGKSITLVGNNFTPNSRITVAFDNQSTTISPGALAQSSLDSKAMMLRVFDQQQSVNGTSTIVGSDGTFEVTLPISASWSIGSTHIIGVYDQNAKLIASKSFTTIANPAPGLAYCDPTVTQEQVKLGPIPAGNPQPTSLEFTLCAQGNKAVNWVDSWNQKQNGWLQLPQNGQIPVGTQSQQIAINASAANLNPGTYKTAIVFSSQISDVKIVLNVTFTVSVPKTCLQVNQSSLSYTVVEGATASGSQQVVVTNCGDYGKWSVATATDDGAGWLNVSPGNGALNPHGSQGVTISTSPASLDPGTYTGHVTFGIGPAKTAVTVNLSVLAPTPTPVPPTPTPKPVPPTPTPIPPTPTPVPVIPTPTPVPVIPTPTPVPVIPTPTPVPVIPTPTPVPVQPTQPPVVQPTQPPVQPTQPPVVQQPTPASQPTSAPPPIQPPVPTPSPNPIPPIPGQTSGSTLPGAGHHHRFGFRG
jgi:hypothetical protein